MSLWLPSVVDSSSILPNFPKFELCVWSPFLHVLVFLCRVISLTSPFFSGFIWNSISRMDPKRFVQPLFWPLWSGKWGFLSSKPTNSELPHGKTVPNPTTCNTYAEAPWLVEPSWSKLLPTLRLQRNIEIWDGVGWCLLDHCYYSKHHPRPANTMYQKSNVFNNG